MMVNQCGDTVLCGQPLISSIGTVLGVDDNGRILVEAVALDGSDRKLQIVEVVVGADAPGQNGGHVTNLYHDRVSVKPKPSRAIFSNTAPSTPL